MPDDTVTTRWSVPLYSVPLVVDVDGWDRPRPRPEAEPSPRPSGAPDEVVACGGGEEIEEAPRSPVPVTPLPSPAGGKGNDAPPFTPHPRYRGWLARCGVASADSVLSLPGEVVSGHPDRHVVRVEISPGRVAFLKREHVAGWRHRLKNWLAGFGKVSRSEREARTLAALEAAGLPGPQWLAFGEDSSGRGFLLVDALPNAADLRAHLDEHTLNAPDRRRLAERVGTALGELHAGGFGTPDLAAKHMLVSDTAVSVIDWPTAPKPGKVSEADAVRWLGTLHAGLPAELFPVRDRLRMLRAYRKARGKLPLRFGFMAKAVHAAAGHRKQKAKAKRHAPAAVPQPLVWVAGEEVVAIPSVAVGWPAPAVCEPFYSSAPPGRERVVLPGDVPAVLVRFRTSDPVGRCVAALRERPWRSPASVAARILFHLQRHGIPAPRLLAFGQRFTSRTAADSFVCAELPAGMRAVSAYLGMGSPAARAAVLVECGRLLKGLHECGLRPTFADGEHDPLFAVVDDTAVSVVVASPFAVKLANKLTRAQRAADMRRFVSPLSSPDAELVRTGYAA